MTVKTFIFNPFQENTYVVSDETGKAVIIDAGNLFDNENMQLSNYIKSNNLKPVHLLNTHLHLDHQFGNKYVFETYGLSPQAHKKDEYMIEKLPETMKGYHFPMTVEGQPIGKYLTEEDEISFGNVKFKILYVPGHSPGSIAFYSEKDNMLFSGDALFKGSIGRTDMPGGDYETLLNSIHKNLVPLPDPTVVYSGHGPATTIGEERISNPYL